MTHLRHVFSHVGITPTVLRRIRVLLAYDRRDRQRVDTLARHLSGDGFDPWLDVDDEPAYRQAEASARDISAAEAVVVCLSSHSAAEGSEAHRKIPAAFGAAADAWRNPQSSFLFRLDRSDVPQYWSDAGVVDATENYAILLELLRERARALGAMVGGSTRPLAYSWLVDLDGTPLTRPASAHSRLLLDVGRLNATILGELRLNPTKWYDLSPAKFEEIVAELLAKQGYSIVRTPLSKDGGFDMYAAKKDGLGEFLYLVECKRYTPPNKVGVDIVRSLKGVLSDQHATAAAIVTTSYFTAGAREFQRRNTYTLKLHDYDTLQQWLAHR